MALFTLEELLPLSPDDLTPDLFSGEDDLTEGLFPDDEERTDGRSLDEDDLTVARPVLLWLLVPDFTSAPRVDSATDERRDTELLSPDFNEELLLLAPLPDERTAAPLLLRADPSLRTILIPALLPLPLRELLNPAVLRPLWVLAYSLSPWFLKSGRE